MPAIEGKFISVKDFSTEELRARKYYKKSTSSLAIVAYPSILFEKLKEGVTTPRLPGLVISFEQDFEDSHIFCDVEKQVRKQVRHMQENHPALMDRPESEGGFDGNAEAAEEFYLRAAHSRIMQLDDYDTGIILPCWERVLLPPPGPTEMNEHTSQTFAEALNTYNEHVRAITDMETKPWDSQQKTGTDRPIKRHNETEPGENEPGENEPGENEPGKAEPKPNKAKKTGK